MPSISAFREKDRKSIELYFPDRISVDVSGQLSKCQFVGRHGRDLLLVVRISTVLSIGRILIATVSIRATILQLNEVRLGGEFGIFGPGQARRVIWEEF